MPQNVLIYQGTDGLVFQGIALIPLSELYDVFKQMPSVASSTGFELRLQSNLSRENSYTLRYGPQAALAALAALAAVIPRAVNSQQIVDHCAPFLLANLSHHGSSGLRIPNAAITVRSYIGWSNTLNHGRWNH